MTLSAGGTFFAFGVVEVQVYRAASSSSPYTLLYTTDPVGPSDGRLLTVLSYEPEEALEPMLLAGFLTDYPADGSQRSLLAAYSPASSSPSWQFDFANTTARYQDTISSLAFCRSGSRRLAAVASWGLGPASNNSTLEDTCHVFDATSGNKVLGFNTLGSMLGSDCTILGSQLFASFAGKHEHANILGSGGEALMLTMQL